MTRQVVASPVRPCDWDEVVAADPGATVYQTRAWFEAAMRLSGAADASRMYVTADGRRLILPMLRRTPLPQIKLDDSYPGRLGSGGLLATGGLRPEDVALVIRDLVRTRSVRTRIKANHDVAEQWRRAIVPGVKSMPRRVEVVDLEGGFRRVWEHRFQSSARRAIRKAERSGLVVERDTEGLHVSRFYELYLTWTARRAAESGLPPSVAHYLALRREPPAVFETVARSLGSACRIWLAQCGGEPVAAVMVLIHGQHALYWKGYSRKELAGPSRANNLLHRLAIEDACEAGCRFYSMGESGGVAALEHFKQTMGATPRSAVECRIERLPLTHVENVVGMAEARAVQIASAAARRTSKHH